MGCLFADAAFRFLLRFNGVCRLDQLLECSALNSVTRLKGKEHEVQVAASNLLPNTYEQLAGHCLWSFAVQGELAAQTPFARRHSEVRCLSQPALGHQSGGPLTSDKGVARETCSGALAARKQTGLISI